MKKRLFLHIGSHKTATTFLQNSLTRNAPALRDLGLLYPKAGRIHGAHFKLCWALKEPATRDSALEDLDDWAALFQEIDAAPEEIVVLSTRVSHFEAANSSRNREISVSAPRPA